MDAISSLRALQGVRDLSLEDQLHLRLGMHFEHKGLRSLHELVGDGLRGG